MPCFNQLRQLFGVQTCEINGAIKAADDVEQKRRGRQVMVCLRRLRSYFDPRKCGDVLPDLTRQLEGCLPDTAVGGGRALVGHLDL